MLELFETKTKKLRRLEKLDKHNKKHVIHPSKHSANYEDDDKPYKNKK